MRQLLQLEGELEQIQKAKKEAMSDQNFELSAKYRLRERELLKEIEDLKFRLSGPENLEG